jgi:LacI family transcriptional regulator, sucrose operon repressor
MKAKIGDVALRAGVSQTTVSRVLNNRGYISQETRDSVYKAMNELNYFPNDLARSLFNKRTNLIGLIVPSTTNPFFGEFSFHLENLASSLGFKVLLCNSLGQVDKEEKYVDMLMRNQVDGIIAAAHYNREIINYQKQNIAVVAIDRFLSDTIPVVGSDNYSGGRLATELLLSKGCRSIVHINTVLELDTPATLRRKAYEDVMAENGLAAVTYEVSNPFDQAEQLATIRLLLDECPDVEGVFASNDLQAACFIAEARRRGRRVPEDIKVIGFDGTETATMLLPELTTIRQSIPLIAKTAIELLIKEIEGQYDELPRETYLPVELVEGGTV